MRRELAGLATVKQFGAVARDFFARFAAKTLASFVSRTLPDHVGADRRFANLAGQRAFADALDTHCREAARIVEAWLSKCHYETGGEISPTLAGHFVSGAMTKLTGELRRGAAADAH